MDTKIRIMQSEKKLINSASTTTEKNRKEINKRNKKIQYSESKKEVNKQEKKIKDSEMLENPKKSDNKMSRTRTNTGKKRIGKITEWKLKGKQLRKTRNESSLEMKSDDIIFKQPQKPGDFSANWKKFQLTIEKDKTTKKKRKPPKTRRKIEKRQNQDSVKSNPKRRKMQELPPEESKKEPEIWFDDVDDILLGVKPDKVETTNALVKEDSFKGLTKAIAMDCEMVGVGEEGIDSILARVSLVNQYGQCIYDKFVKATEKVTDYRTFVSGVRAKDLQNAEAFPIVQKEVSDILKNRILVGHALRNDLQVLFLDHPRKKIRDTSRHKPFRRLFNGRNPSLKKLTEKVLGVKVQQGEHSSVQDAQAAMRLYTMYRQTWEKEIKVKRKKTTNSSKTR